MISLARAMALVLVLVLVWCSALPASVHALPYTGAIPIGIVWPMASDPLAIQLPVQLALSDLASLSLLPSSTPIVPVFLNSTGTAIGSTRALLDEFYARSTGGQQLVAVIGDANDAASAALGTVGSSAYVNLPVLSPSLTSTATSVGGAQYQYLLRLNYSDAALAWSAYSLVQYYGWQLIAVIYSDDDHGRGFMQQFLSSFPAVNSINTFAIPSASTGMAENGVTQAATTRVLQSIQQMGIRVIVLHSSDAITVVRTAELLGMIGRAPYTWIGTDWCQDATIRALADADSMLGTVCVSASTVPDTAGWAGFSSRLVALRPDYYATNSVAIMAGTIYDSVMLLATALQAVTYSTVSPSPSVLYAYLLTSKYSGVTGPVAFPSVTCSSFPTSCSGLTAAGVSDRLASPMLVNYHQETQTFISTGSFTFNSSQSNYTYLPFTAANVVVWSDQSNHAQSDRPNVYYEGEVVPTSTDNSVVVLSFGVAAFGSWCALILLEQAVSSRHATRAATSVSGAPAIAALSAIARSSPSHWKWMAWLIAASLALSSCSVWSMHYLQLQSRAVNTVTITISVLPFVLSLFYCWFLCLGILVALMMTVKPRVSESGTNSSLLDSTHTTSQTGLTQHSIPSESGESKSQSKARSLSGTEHSKPSRQWRQRLDSHMLTAMLPTLGRWNGLAAILTTLLVLTQHEIALQSMEGGFTVSHSASAILSSTFLVLLLSWIPELWMFHLFHSRLRPLASFSFAGLTLGASMISTNGLQFYYAPTDTLPIMDTFASNSFVNELTLAIVCLAVCLSLMLMNVTQLKRDRMLIDRVIRKADATIHSAQSQLKIMQSKLHSSGTIRDQQARLLESMSYLRPHYRVFALPIVMADRVQGEHDEATDSLVAKLSSSHHASEGSSFTGSRRSQHNDEAGNGRASTNSNNTLSVGLDSQLADWMFGCKNETQILSQLPSSIDAKLAAVDVIATTSGAATAAGSDTKLSSLLHHPLCMELIKDVAVAGFTPENISLYSLIQLYMRLDNAGVRALIANELHPLYIADGSGHEVNISATMKESLMRAFQLGTFRRDMYHEVTAEVLKLMSTNYAEALNKSIVYKQSLPLINQASAPKQSQTTATPPANGEGSAWIPGRSSPYQSKTSISGSTTRTSPAGLQASRTLTLNNVAFSESQYKRSVLTDLDEAALIPAPVASMLSPSPSASNALQLSPAAALRVSSRNPASRSSPSRAAGPVIEGVKPPSPVLSPSQLHRSSGITRTTTFSSPKQTSASAVRSAAQHLPNQLSTEEEDVE